MAGGDTRQMKFILGLWIEMVAGRDLGRLVEGSIVPWRETVGVIFIETEGNALRRGES